MTTKGASFSYEEVIDLHTESDRVTVIGIHTPTGDTPRRMAPGLFSQFKKYKYLGCSVMMVPAATLPVDPLGVSYEAGEVPQIDPRDMLNPILFHGCHGNDLGNILNRIYSANAVEGSDLSQILGTDSSTLWSMFNSEEGTGTIPSPGLSLLESLYYRALTDRTWQKANIQRGFKKRGLHPRVYTLATNMQLMGEALYTGRYNAPAPFYGEDASDPYLGDGFDVTDPASNPVRFFTPRTQRLGWLDTRTVVGYDSKQSLGFVPDIIADAKIEGVIKDGTVETRLPKIYMGIILLPPAYKTEQYFRMIITHRFAFAGFRGISMSDLELRNPNYFNLNDKLSEGGSDEPDSPVVPDPGEPTVGQTVIAGFNNESPTPVKYGFARFYETRESSTPLIVISPEGDGPFFFRKVDDTIREHNSGLVGNLILRGLLDPFGTNDYPAIYLTEGGFRYRRANGNTFTTKTVSSIIEMFTDMGYAFDDEPMYDTLEMMFKAPITEV